MPQFVCQSSLSDSSDYYEQIIYQQQLIPTRPDSWHDLFNGLIWLQFPQVKQLLNQLHIEDIKQHGLSPRTLRRNNITHFDECGVIVTVEEGYEFLLEQLSQHQWQSVFVDHRDFWGQKIQHFMFGHANLEMLLQPFIGLTGKWLGLIVPKGFARLPLKQQLVLVDKQLIGQISQDNVFAHKKALLPIPLLGIPGCYPDNQHAAFYQNTDYFRPKPRERVSSKV
ncbi:DUF3025 domain-containing protein [Paraglaciecola sp.]|uniref:DUF3025 domain-containing protein n=1 Tax=Paraglaciecola sp. TaxID=1920173 RepID=UPI0030F40D94